MVLTSTVKIPTWLEILIIFAKKEINSIFPKGLSIIDGRSTCIVPDIIKSIFFYIINILDATDQRFMIIEFSDT